MSPAALQTIHASSRRWASLSDGQASPHELTYLQLVARRAAQLADRELVVDSSVRYTFGQFEREMMQAARAAIAAGAVPGDRVAVWAPNSARWLVAAILRAAVTGPLDTQIVVLDGDAEAPDLTWEEFIAGGGTVPLARAEAVRDSISPQTPADIILTSGTCHGK